MNHFRSVDPAEWRRPFAALKRTLRRALMRLAPLLGSKGAGPHQTRPENDDPLLSPRDTEAFAPDVHSLRRDASKKARFNNLTHLDYYAYTKEFDETIDALSMLDAAEANFLASRLSKLKVDRRAQTQHAKHLLAASLQGCAAGGVAVSFLIDNSGSMRGEKIAKIVCWISEISSVLSGLGIAHEVLGFTTREWIGGRSRALWISDGRPPSPGRLNDLRHIVYKSFEAHGDADRTFALMLSPAILRENVDGEALLWAYSRLSVVPQTRKILLFISDGAPVDDSTLNENSEKILRQHLLKTIEWIGAGSKIELYGIGIDFRIQDYYDEHGFLIEDEHGWPRFAAIIVNILSRRAHAQ